KELADEYLAAMIIGVDPAASSSGFSLGGMGSGDRPEPPAGGMPPAGGEAGGPMGGSATDRSAIVPGGTGA
ncbi:hypothetical protein RSW49_24145, partial [Escherichia coli]|uniref:hypothetical protein n=1 Tax=Escherichia coli TaxID=562 RepID=UPI0028DFFEB3